LKHFPAVVLSGVVLGYYYISHILHVYPVVATALVKVRFALAEIIYIYLKLLVMILNIDIWLVWGRGVLKKSTQREVFIAIPMMVLF